MAKEVPGDFGGLNSIDVCISCSYNPNCRRVQSEIARAFFVHVLYMRGIIGSPFEELAREAALIYAMEKPPMGSRKLASLYTQLASLLSSTDVCVQQLGVKRLCVLLGPSINNSLESYTIEFVGTEDFGGPSSCPPSEKQISAARRRVLQALIQEQASWDMASAPRASAFLAIETPSADLSTVPDDVFVDFGFRDSFRGPAQQQQQLTPSALGKRKARKPALLVRVLWKRIAGEEALPELASQPVDAGASSDGAATAAVDSDRTAEGGGDEQSAWLVSKKGVKALRV
jgi:hypothetical protein